LSEFSLEARWSFSTSVAFCASSMGATWQLEPMMSSRYSRIPSSCAVGALGFIIEICSTSPCRIRKRLWSRSMPRWRSSLVTSVKLLVLPLTMYLDELSRRASRETSRQLPGTTSKPPSSRSMMSWK